MLQGQEISESFPRQIWTLAIAEPLGLYALTLEAINQRRARQYERWGFKYCVEGALDMYIALPTIRKAGLAPLRD